MMCDDDDDGGNKSTIISQTISVLFMRMQCVCVCMLSGERNIFSFASQVLTRAYRKWFCRVTRPSQSLTSSLNRRKHLKNYIL